MLQAKAQDNSTELFSRQKSRSQHWEKVMQAGLGKHVLNHDHTFMVSEQCHILLPVATRGCIILHVMLQGLVSLQLLPEGHHQCGPHQVRCVS